MPQLVSFPVAAKESPYWRHLNGQPFTFHALGTGTGTEAIGNNVAKREGIEFGQHNYLPGSEPRIIAKFDAIVDERTRSRFQKVLLAVVARERKTSIFATHFIEETTDVSDRNYPPWMNRVLSVPLTTLVLIFMVIFGLGETAIIMTAMIFAFAFTLNEVLAWLERKVDYYAAARH